MRNFLYPVILFLVFISCQSGNSPETDVTEGQKTTNTMNSVHVLPPLQEGEFSISENDFGEIIELKGTTHPVDQLFRVSETEMIALDGILLVKNNHENKAMMVYSLPSFEYIKSVGPIGRGPDEFMFPNLVKNESDDYLCFLYERNNSTLFGLDSQFKFLRLDFNFQGDNGRFNDRQLHGISPNEFFYVVSTKSGKSVFHAAEYNDSIQTEEILDLAFSDDNNNWASCIGDFGINGKKNRIVYAYKYFKRLLFYDIEKGVTKVLDFKQKDKATKGNAASVLAPTNVTHYWGMSTNENHVYVLYSGRTPIEVSEEFKTSSGYIFIEQFDWNGNPIKKYRLDHWGYFCVDKKEENIYLASVTDEQPFISYKISGE